MATNLTVQQKKDVAFWALIVSGVGCCVGGAFFPPLIPVGAALLSGAIAIARDTSPSNEQSTQEHQPHHDEDNRSPSSDDNIGLDFHVGLTHHRHHLQSRSAEPVNNQIHIDDEKNDNRNISKRHKRS
jgi:hypothetical protein